MQNFRQLYIESLLGSLKDKAKMALNKKYILFSNDVSEVKDLLREFPNTDVNIVYDKINKKTPLHTAHFPDKVELLLSWGANPNLQDSNGDTPLHIWASSSWDEDSVEVCEMLLNKGADPTIKNNLGQTALDVAKWKKNDQVVEILEYWINEKL